MSQKNTHEGLTAEQHRAAGHSAETRCIGLTAGTTILAILAYAYDQSTNTAVKLASEGTITSDFLGACGALALPALFAGVFGLNALGHKRQAHRLELSSGRLERSPV